MTEQIRSDRGEIVIYMDNKTGLSQNGFQLLSKYRGALMGIAALSIYFFHAWIPITLEPQHSSVFLLSFLEHFSKKIGFFGVDIFMLLSGIGITFAIKKESLPKFYYRRIRRLLLPFATVGIIRGITQNWGWKVIIGNLTGFNFFAKDINSFLWFVPAIAILYLLFPLYYKIFNKFPNKILFTAGVIMIWLLISVMVKDIMREDLFGFTNRIPVFVIGILIGYLIQNGKGIDLTVHSCILLFIMLFTGLYLAYVTNFKDFYLIVPLGNSFLPNLFISISLSLLVSKLFEMLEKRFSKFAGIILKIIGFFGMISLEFYCVQSWFIDIIPLLTEDGWSKHLVNIMLFFIITALSWVAYVLFKYFWEFIEHISKPGKTKTA